MAEDAPEHELIAAEQAALTWEPPDPGEWDFDASHQSSPATATAQEIMPVGFRTGFTQCFERFGLPLSHMAIEYVNGWAYVSPFVHGAPRKGNGKAPPALIMKVLTRVQPSARRRANIAAASIADRLTMRDVDRYDALRPDWVASCLELQDVDLEAISDDELADEVHRTAAHLLQGHTHHFDFLGQAFAVGEYLVRTKDWGLDPKAAAKAAFHGVQSSTEAHGRLQAIVSALGDTEAETLAQVRGHSADAASALDDYLRHHGSWVLTDDLNGGTLAELPEVVVHSINTARAGAPDETQAIEAAASACRAQLSSADAEQFEALLAEAQRAYAALDDNSGILSAWPAGLARRAHLAAARRLVERGVLDDVEHVWVLRPAEIADLITGAAALSTDEIAHRVRRQAANAALTPPAHLGSPPSPPPDASVFPAPVAQNVRYLFAFMGAKFGGASSLAFGIGEQPVTGRAVVARSAEEALARIEDGDVLVTTYTTPAYNAVMPLLGAVVTTAGGPNSHAAVVARELGVAAVVGLADALDTIVDGSTVEVDPVTATVRAAG